MTTSPANFQRTISARIVSIPLYDSCTGVDVTYQTFTDGGPMYSWTRDDSEELDFSGFPYVETSTVASIEIPSFQVDANYVATSSGYLIRFMKVKSFYRPDPNGSTKWAVRSRNTDLGRYVRDHAHMQFSRLLR